MLYMDNIQNVRMAIELSKVPNTHRPGPEAEEPGWWPRNLLAVFIVMGVSRVAALGEFEPRTNRT